MDSLIFALVLLATLALVGLPLIGRGPAAPADHEEQLPSLATALTEDLATGKLTPEQYREADGERSS